MYLCISLVRLVISFVRCVFSLGMYACPSFFLSVCMYFAIPFVRQLFRSLCLSFFRYFVRCSLFSSLCLSLFPYVFMYVCLSLRMSTFRPLVMYVCISFLLQLFIYVFSYSLFIYFVMYCFFSWFVRYVFLSLCSSFFLPFIS